MATDDNVALPSTERLVDGVVQCVNVVLAVLGALCWAYWLVRTLILCD
jgi:hypothetical protein